MIQSLRGAVPDEALNNVVAYYNDYLNSQRRMIDRIAGLRDITYEEQLRRARAMLDQNRQPNP